MIWTGREKILQGNYMASGWCFVDAHCTAGPYLKRFMEKFYCGVLGAEFLFVYCLLFFLEEDMTNPGAQV